MYGVLDPNPAGANLLIDLVRVFRFDGNYQNLMRVPSFRKTPDLR